VDLDFPTVLRAMGPLDSIVQGSWPLQSWRGDCPMVVSVSFVPTDGGTPPGVYKTAIGQTSAFLAGFDLEHELLQSLHFAQYFEALFNCVDTGLRTRAGV